MNNFRYKKFILHSINIIIILMVINASFSSCRKNKKVYGAKITVINCEGTPLFSTITIKLHDGTVQTHFYNGVPITVETKKNTQILVAIKTTNGVVYNEVIDIGKNSGYIESSFEICEGFESVTSSSLIVNGVSFFAKFKTDNNYSITYNPTTNATYFIAPIQQMPVNETYPWQTGSCTLKINGKTPADLFSSNAISIALSTDTTESYLKYVFFSIDTINYPSRLIIFNSAQTLNINTNKQFSTNFFEASSSTPLNVYGANVYNTSTGTFTGSDRMSVNFKVFKKL